MAGDKDYYEHGVDNYGFVADGKDILREHVVRNAKGKIIYDMRDDPRFAEYLEAVAKIGEGENLDDADIKIRIVQEAHRILGPYAEDVRSVLSRIEVVQERLVILERMQQVGPEELREMRDKKVAEANKDLGDLQMEQIRIDERRGLSPVELKRYDEIERERKDNRELSKEKEAEIKEKNAKLNDFYAGKLSPKDVQGDVQKVLELRREVDELSKINNNLFIEKWRLVNNADQSKTERYGYGQCICDIEAAYVAGGLQSRGYDSRYISGYVTYAYERDGQSEGHAFVQTKDDGHIIEATDPVMPLRYNVNGGSIMLGQTAVTLNFLESEAAAYGTGRQSDSAGRINSDPEKVFEYDIKLLSKTSDSWHDKMLETAKNLRDGGVISAENYKEGKENLAKQIEELRDFSKMMEGKGKSAIEMERDNSGERAK